MCLLVDFQCVSGTLIVNTGKSKSPSRASPVWKTLATHLAVHRFLTGVKLLDVQPEVGLTAAGGGAELTLVDWLVSGVDGAVSFQTVTLGEPGVADITLVRFFAYKHQQ